MFGNKFIAVKFSLLFVWIVHLSFRAANSFQNKSEYIGIVYSVYCKQVETQSQLDEEWKTYSLKSVETMLEIISTKFSKVATYGVGADNVPYVWNVTYYNSFSQVFSAEAAALVNLKNNKMSISMLVGIWQSDSPQQMKTEMELAIESVKKANARFPGSAEGVVFSQSDIQYSITRAHQTLENIRIFRNESTDLDLKIGVRMSCDRIHSENANNQLALIHQSIITESDFIICQIYPVKFNDTVESTFDVVKNDLLLYRNELLQINPRIEIMGETGWPSRGANSWENLDNLQEYWNFVNEFSVENNFTMWLLESFDNPWKNWNSRDAHFGWWRLKNNSDVEAKESYVEKVSDDTSSEQNLSPWIYIGAAVASLAIVCLLTISAILFLRVHNLKKSLSKKDVRDFIYGNASFHSTQSSNENIGIESAFKAPYDKSFEIPKNKLTIRHEDLLGSGQFGCVFKAVIEKEGEETEVALKMAKPDCPIYALKGLLSEIKVLIHLGKHENIAVIVGAYTAELLNGVVYIATELCSLGSLESYLRQNKPKEESEEYLDFSMLPMTSEIPCESIKTEVTFTDMISWSHDIACGMEYIGTKHVVHADLAARNILLSFNKTAKITDFGLSRRLYDYTTYIKKGQGEPLPWRWMSVESLQRMEFSSKSDVWSYGILLWEIFSMGDIPYSGLSWNVNFVDDLLDGMRMNRPSYASREIYEIMGDCWSIEAIERPNFSVLREYFSRIININSNDGCYEILLGDCWFFKDDN